MSASALRQRRDALMPLLGVTAPPALVELCDAAIAHGLELEEERDDASRRQADLNIDLMRELEQVCPECRAAIDEFLRGEG